jgi:hypothetical protein
MTTLHSEDSRYIREILHFFFGASPEVITEEYAGLAARLIYESVETSLAWDLISDPPGFVPDSSWILSDAVRKFWHTYGREKIREAIRLAVAEKYQADFDRIIGEP